MTYSEKLKDPRWQKKRLEILKRDEFACKICGDTKSTLHIHHIAYSNNPWETENRLLITLCEYCHEQEEKDLKSMNWELIKALRESGLTANGMYQLSKLFKDTDRNWTFYEPAFSVLKLVVDDDDLWNKVESIFWERLQKKLQKKDDE